MCKDLVQTSNNVARIEFKDGKYTVMCLTRSSVTSEKMDEANAIKAVFELIDAKVEFPAVLLGARYRTPKRRS